MFDFETTGLVPGEDEPVSLGGKAYNARTLEPYPLPGGEFYSLMRPMKPERLDLPKVKEALAYNKITREELLGDPGRGVPPAPDQKAVWNRFVDWVATYNKGKTSYTAPIAAGKNIRKFDLKFVEVLNRLHCKKKDKTVLFNRKELDLEDQVFLWFEADGSLKNEKMDTLRDFFGMSQEGAHNALVDVRQEGELIFRFLKLHRELRARVGKDGTPLIKFGRAA